MTETEIIVLHDMLYEYLNALHEEDPSFMFRVRRMNNKGKKGDEDDDKGRLQKGYWFNGNADYLETSFWDYKDNLHQTPIIRLVYYFEFKKWACELVARDPKVSERVNYFEQLAKTLGGFIKDKKQNIWRKDILNTEDFLTTLNNFIKVDKLRIDTYLNNNPVETVSFIRPESFEKDIKRIEPRVSNPRRCFIKEHIRLLNDTSSHIPFALSRIQISDFQGIKNVIVSDIPTDAQWIFLTGENGFGKTSVLRAIALGLVGDEYADEKYLTDTTIYVNGYNSDKPFLYEVNEQKLSDNNYQLAAYGVSRFRYHDESDKNKKKTFSLFSDEGQLINIERILIDAEQSKEREKAKGIQVTTFDRLKSIFLKIIPKLADIEVIYIESEPITSRYQVRYSEQDDENNRYKPVKINDLAAGYRSILTMIGDMVVRLSNNQHNGFDDIEGIVLIDEIDAHLHPKYQYELPKLLSEVFPKVQFIASTHSPIPILGLPQTVKSIVLTVDRTPEKGITVDRLDDDIEIGRLSANALLSSEIFNFKDIFARGATPDTIEPFDDYKEIKEKNESEKLLGLKKTFKKLNIKIKLP